MWQYCLTGFSIISCKIWPNAFWTKIRLICECHHQSNILHFCKQRLLNIRWLYLGLPLCSILITDYLEASEARATVAAGWEGRFGVCCWENTELEPEAEVPPPPPEVVCAGGGCGEDDVDGESFVNCCWADALARNSAARNCSKWNCCLSWN